MLSALLYGLDTGRGSSCWPPAYGLVWVGGGVNIAWVLQRGGWLTVALVVFIGILAGISFWQFFTLFHHLFFSGDSWLFLYSDTLIRLFPMRFWQDAFLFTGILDLVAGLGLGLGLLSKGKQGVITDDIIPTSARRHDG